MQHKLLLYARLVTMLCFKNHCKIYINLLTMWHMSFWKFEGVATLNWWSLIYEKNYDILFISQSLHLKNLHKNLIFDLNHYISDHRHVEVWRSLDSAWSACLHHVLSKLFQKLPTHINIFIIKWVGLRYAPCNQWQHGMWNVKCGI
jgi:hypothetical protein